MTVFADDYARYYDLLYQDKDYASEVGFVEKLIRTHCPSASSILEFGCGTGRHAELLVRQGFRLHGIDCSDGMLHEARARRELLPPELSSQLKFTAGDIREVRLGKRFDAVISLFHVMSYQVENADLEAALATARAHLAPGGVFIFDFWYGPAVLSDKPQVRVKRLDDEAIAMTRIAEPLLRPDENAVTVNYDIMLERKIDRAFSRFHESHHMRYLFLPELVGLFERHGMQPIFFCEWMTGNSPGLSTWSVCAGGRVTAT